MSSPSPRDPEHYWTYFISNEHVPLFQFSSLEARPDVNITSILSCCTPNDEPFPDIVFSMEMGDYFVDIASCFNLYCVFIIEPSSVDHKSASSLYPLTSLFVLSLIAQSESSSELNFKQLAILPSPVETCFLAFSLLVDGIIIEQVGLVSPLGNIYCTVGNFMGSTASFSQCWEVVLDLLQVIEENPYVTESGCDCVAAVDFLPSVKLAVFFRESISHEEARECLPAFYQRTLALKPLLVSILLAQPTDQS